MNGTIFELIPPMNIRNVNAETTIHGRKLNLETINGEHKLETA